MEHTIDFYFKNYKKYAFRLGVLQSYSSAEEKESLQKFQETGEFDAGFLQEWQSEIKEAQQRGAKHLRVQVMENPVSPYMQFGIEGMLSNVKAGEQMHIIDKEDFDQIASACKTDYWLFDDEAVFEMEYDAEGTWIACHKVEGDIAEYIDMKNRLLEKGAPLEEWISK